MRCRHPSNVIINDFSQQHIDIEFHIKIDVIFALKFCVINSFRCLRWQCASLFNINISVYKQCDKDIRCSTRWYDAFNIVQNIYRRQQSKQWNKCRDYFSINNSCLCLSRCIYDFENTKHLRNNWQKISLLIVVLFSICYCFWIQWLSLRNVINVWQFDNISHTHQLFNFETINDKAPSHFKVQTFFVRFCRNRWTFSLTLF